MNPNNVCICLLFVLIQNIHALRCHSGNQQINDEVTRVMLKCKRHNYDSEKINSNSSGADESNESDSSLSDGNVFNREFFSNPMKELQNSTRNSESKLSLRRNGPDSYRHKSAIQSLYVNSSNYSRMRENQRQTSNNNNKNGFMLNEMQRNNNNNKTIDDNYREQSVSQCSAQCFFDELNSVNQQGFPERLSVTRMIMRGIQDPILRDFLEESVLECFQFLTSEVNIDKCTFSQNLLNCLADKGREQCEDWYD